MQSTGGRGAETRLAIGVVVIGGVTVATFFTLFVVPVAYSLLARGTGSPGAVKRRLEREAGEKKENVIAEAAE